MNELFLGWKDDPPTNLLLQAIINGFGGGKRGSRGPQSIDELPEELRNRPGLPVIRGRDPGLPKTAPILDIEAMRQKNIDRTLARARKRTNG